jgi:hypothetical protein
MHVVSSPFVDGSDTAQGRGSAASAACCRGYAPLRVAVRPPQRRDRPMLVTILIVLLILALIGGLPTWGYSRSWGYGPSGIVGTILIILVVLWLLGRI